MNDQRLIAYAVMALSLAACASPNPSKEFDSVPCKRFNRMRECAAVPLASLEEDRAAKEFGVPSTGRAKIYVVRRYTTEPMEKSEVKLNGKAVGVLAPQTYVVFEVRPGAQTIDVGTKHRASIRVDAEPNRVYYIEYIIAQWFNSVTGELSIENEKKGQSLIRPSKKAVSTLDLD